MKQQYFSNMQSLQIIKSPTNVIDVYAYCCSGLRLMPTLQAKRFLVRLAIKIHSLLQPRIEPSTETIAGQNTSTQTDVEGLPTTESSLCSTHSHNIHQSVLLQSQNEVLDQAIEKYQNLIQSLYKQIDDAESEHESRLEALRTQYEALVKQNRINHSQQTRVEECKCPAEELRAEVARLKKQIKKKDKQLIRKLKLRKMEDEERANEDSQLINE